LQRDRLLAVVDVETWEKVQQRLKERVTGQRHGQPNAIFFPDRSYASDGGARLVLDL